MQQAMMMDPQVMMMMQQQQQQMYDPRMIQRGYTNPKSSNSTGTHRRRGNSTASSVANSVYSDSRYISRISHNRK